MDLNRGRWYVRWYFWSLAICEEFGDKRDTLTRKVTDQGTNLCAFMRTIFIYAPLTILFHAVIYVGGLLAFTVLPVYLLGWKGYGLMMGGIVGLCVFIFVIAMLITLIYWLKDKRISRADKPKPPVTNPSFVRLLGRYAKAKKQKICPLITFSSPNQEQRQ